MSEQTMQITDNFVSMLNAEYHKNANMEHGSPYWRQLKRDFSKIYMNEIPCYVHFEKANVSLRDGYQHEVRKLLGYLVAHDVIVFTSGGSIGTALRVMERKESDLNFILNGNIDQVIREVRNFVGLMRARGVRLNAYTFIRDMYNWKSQESHSNKNWVRKSWVRDYMNRKEEA